MRAETLASVLFIIALIGTAMSPKPVNSSHQAEPLRLPQAKRGQFDRITIMGADYAFLKPDTGIERIEAGIKVRFGVAFADGFDAIVYRVDPDVDYTVTAFNYVLNGEPYEQFDTHQYDFYLPMTRALTIDYASYNRLSGLFDFFEVVEVHQVTLDEAEASIARMRIRIQNEQ